MLTNNYKITALAHDDILAIIAEKYDISLTEAADVVKQLSFKEYNFLIEANGDRANIPSPSGIAPIGGDPASKTQNITPTGTQTAPGTINGMPSVNKNTTIVFNPGDKVSTTDANGAIVDYEVVSQDNNAGTAIVRNAQTGQEQTHNLQDLKPADKNTIQSGQPKPVQNNGQVQNPFQQALGAATQLTQSATYDEKELTRILELAGIKETASCGATSAGGIATIAQPMGSMQKRYKQAEEVTDKTIHGKIDPNAATGELSRRLVDRKMKTASRKNNGKKIT